MANLTLSFPDDLYEEMKKYPEIRWSEVARQALAKKLTDLRRLDTLLRDSELRDSHIDELGKKVRQGVWKKHRGSRS